jgi:energy-coupling factor transporter ATP-binding protein EcfA2
MSKTFKAVDFMGIRGEAVITPNGHEIVVLAGPNGAGKSSFRLALQSIFKYDSKLIPDPIREGQSESRAEFTDTDLDVRLERVWKLQADGSIKSTLAAYALDGAKYDKPSDFVAKLIGAELIDPSQFVNYDDKKQREVLLKKVTLPFDPDERAAKRKAYFDGRTDVSREVKRLTALHGSLTKPDATTPTDEVSQSAVLAELEAAKASNTNRFTLQSNITVIRGRIASLEQELIGTRAALTTALEVIASCSPVADTDAIRVRLTAVEEINAGVRDAKTYHAVESDLAEVLAKESGLNAKLDAIDKEVTDGLAAAEFPFDGLSVTDDGVTVDGRAFASLNEGEAQFVAFEIATSGDPTLKLIFIKNGDSLDNITLSRIAARGKERGWTIIADRGRDNSAEFGFVFDEGVLAVSS